MADTTTELEVLDQIVDVLGGTSGQYETVVPTLQQILALLGGGGGGSGSGYNPSLSVGRADALTGADSTAQWAQRESTGSGTATVRSVQGNAQKLTQLADPLCEGADYKTRMEVTADGTVTTFTSTSSTAAVKFVEFVIAAGHKALLTGRYTAGSTTVQCGLYQANSASYAAGSRINMEAGATQDVALIVEATETYNAIRVANLPTAAQTGESFTVENLQVFDLTAMYGAGNEPSTVEAFRADYPFAYYPRTLGVLVPVRIAGISSTDANGNALDSVEWPTQTLRAAGSVRDELTAGELVTRVGSRAYQSGDESDATVRTDGTTTYYPLVTPTTTPISPALPTSYKVQAGGSESIIVPDGEVSAAPIITVAEGESVAELVMDALACIAAPDGPTAKANHAVNTYLTMGGKLYKVTTAIAVGETIAAGTNVTETTVMAELIARTA